MFDLTCWHRDEFESLPIYLNPGRPEWFVPNTAGDRVLRDLAAAGGDPAGLSAAARRFLARLPDAPPDDYPGRAARLHTERLEELWLHLTNRCNLECTHCLFCSSPRAAGELDTRTGLERIAQARALGCQVFAFTGGEPLVHPGFADMVDAVLEDPQAHVVCLSNGLLLERSAERLRRWSPERFHLQLSLDGVGALHDALRGEGTFERLRAQLRWLRAEEHPFTLSLGVREQNRSELPRAVELAYEHGASNLHFMWYFVAGRGRAEERPDSSQLFEPLRRAQERARTLGVTIDNLDSLRSQVFAPPGTIHDGTGAGWDSLAVGPDGDLYPSAALVGRRELSTPVTGDLARAWREGPVLEALRNRTVVADPSPWRLILGGGDLDHAYAQAGSFDGADPYLPLQRELARWLIAEEATAQPDGEVPALRLKMGDVLESCGAHGDVALVHSNCLLGVAGPAGSADSRAPIKAFYGRAAEAPNTDIVNPAGFPEELVAHVPDEARLRSYGCGSPVLDAALEAGETVMDLGCGAGLECFVAASLVGAGGRVIGVDMLDRMLSLAEQGAAKVAQRLGYRNTEFRSGYIEALPLEDASVDVVLSNCVLNLCTHKRRAWAEIYRVLRPGGRLVVSDVVCERSPPAAIRNDETLRGECIGGALTERDLVGLLEETGFCALQLRKRFPYRVVAGHPFFSLTFEARRPVAKPGGAIRAQYRGPFSAVLTLGGQVLRPGDIADLEAEEVDAAGEQVFVLDDGGSVTNVALEGSCCCAPPELTSLTWKSHQLPPVRSSPAPLWTSRALGNTARIPCGRGRPQESRLLRDRTTPGEISRLAEPGSKPGPLVALQMASAPREAAGCMVCGAPLVYLAHDEEADCAYCGQPFAANARCEEGHFVCDGCHGSEGRPVMERLLLASTQRDLVALFARVRAHPSISVHGPEHHALVPGVILAALRNSGAPVTDDDLRAGLDRGGTVPGGYCGHLGGCGAALGAGAALAIFLKSSPVTPSERQRSIQLVSELLKVVGEHEAGRCCQRDSWLVLREVARRSEALFGVRLTANASLRCGQVKRNAECIRERCPLFPTNVSRS